MYGTSENAFLFTWDSTRCQHRRKMLSCDQIIKLASLKSVNPWENYFEQTEFLPKDLNLYRWDF